MKNILVIGGAAGIGAALVQIVIDRGYKVWATYHNAEPDFSASTYR